MRSWKGGEDGPTCRCGGPTTVMACGDEWRLVCIFHTKAEGASFVLPAHPPADLPEDPEQWPAVLWPEEKKALDRQQKNPPTFKVAMMRTTFA